MEAFHWLLISCHCEPQAKQSARGGLPRVLTCPRNDIFLYFITTKCK